MLQCHHLPKIPHSHIFSPFSRAVPREGTPWGWPSPAHLLDLSSTFRVSLGYLPHRIPWSSHTHPRPPGLPFLLTPNLPHTLLHVEAPLLPCTSASPSDQKLQGISPTCYLLCTQNLDQSWPLGMLHGQGMNEETAIENTHKTKWLSSIFWNPSNFFSIFLCRSLVES